ncbi:hypothetical protein PCLA_16r0037 [Pseudomonas citronellolis]|nr:hypothetical protein PCLA_16r0037 [Pseudomonas citronellolis]
MQGFLNRAVGGWRRKAERKSDRACFFVQLPASSLQRKGW